MQTAPTPASLVQTGGELHLKGDSLGARLHYQAALGLDSNYLPALANMGVILSTEGNLLTAEATLRKVCALAPNDGNQWNNFGNVLMRNFKYEEAKGVLLRASELSPENSGTWHNLALLTNRIGDYDSCEGYIARAKALGSSTIGLDNDLALTLLSKGGNLARALEVYEARWETIPHSRAWDYHLPEWKGEALEGKRILFHAEQGYGDTLMTLRFVKNLEALGAQITCGVLPAMIRLCEAQGFVAVDLFKFNENDAKEFDFHSPMFSAMRYLGINQDSIDPRPYLRAPEVVTPQLQSGYNVGICWASGKRGGELDWRRRVAPLEDWLNLAAIPGVNLYSLQAGPDGEDIKRIGADILISDPMSKFTNWADTAAFVSKLDLVISVDTAVAHLAGALGKPIWMLSQHMHCWRWWGLAQGNGLPWYESMRILRQSDPFEWKSLLNTCASWLIQELEIKQRKSVA